MFNTLTRMGASGAGDYEISKSLRFNPNDSTYLDQTPSSTGNRRTFTFSCWFKRSSIGSDHTIFQQREDSNSSRTFGITIRDTDDLRIIAQPGTGGSDMVYDSTQLFRDTSAWYHLVVAVDTTDSLADRQKIYLNGVQITDWAQSNNYSADFDNSVNHASKRVLIGVQRPNSSSTLNNYFDGYLAEIHLIDGLRLNATSFGETNEDTGQWIPKKYVGAYGTCGFYLDFKDNSNTTSGTLGKDSSGNGLNFTPNNFSVSAGEGNDSLEDTPTNNCCTLNPLKGYSTTYPSLSNGNLDASLGSTSHMAFSSIAIPPSGKWYAECKFTDVETGRVGIKLATDTSQFNGVMYLQGGQIRVDTSIEQSSLATISDNDIVGIAVDRDADTIQFYKNGSTVGSTESISATGDYLFVQQRNGSSGSNPQGSWNFGQRAFGNLPSGFKALTVNNLPTPTIKKGTDYFNTVLYTGNGSDGRAVTGVGFQPNLVWIANRDRSTYKPLYDSVAGATKMLRTNTDDAEGTFSTVLQSFDSDGFTVGTDSAHNHNNEDIVSWNWKEGASNGFDIVSFTPSSGTNTYSHSLGVKPDFIIFKSRGSDANWDVYSSALTAEYKLYLNGADLKIDSGFMNDTEPTSSVFSFNPGNQDGNVHTALCFANVEGYSKAGMYTGNGSSNGVFIYTGFKPSYFLVKRTEDGGGQDWEVRDTGRNTYNPVGTRLIPNETYAESALAAKDIDFVSNGFKIRTNSSGVNSDGIEYVYLAFAETPFKYATAR